MTRLPNVRRKRGRNLVRNLGQNVRLSVEQNTL